MNRYYLVVAFCLIGIAACSGTTEVDGLKVKKSDFKHYVCDDNRQFYAAFPSQEAAVLKTSERSYRLVRIVSGSGSKYILDDETASVTNPVTLYTKGKDARLEVNGIIYKTCKVE